MFLAFLSGILTYAATTGGLFIVIPWAQSSVVAGIAVGLVAPRSRSSILAGVAVGLLGAVIGPRNIYGSFFPSLVSSGLLNAAASSLLCAAVVAGVGAALSRYPKSAAPILAAALLLLVGNLWFTTLRMNDAPLLPPSSGVVMPSFNDELSGAVAPTRPSSDGVLFLDVYREMKTGKGFYPAYSAVIARRGGTGSVADYRVPLMFWLWRALPDASYIVLAFLVFATAAILSVVAVSALSVKIPLALPGAAALTAYLAVFPSSTVMFQLDEWAGALAVLALALYAASLTARKWRLLTVLCVTFAVLAVLTRETAGFLLVAGFASAFIGDRRQRGFRAAAWTIGVVVFAASYLAHYAAARPYITPNGIVPRAGEGGIAFMTRGLTYATVFLGQNGWLPIVLALLGVVAALAVPDIRMRLFALGFVLATVVSFLFLGNLTRGYGLNGEIVTMNYWGAAVIPFLYALGPSALAVIPGAESSLRQPVSRREPATLRRGRS